MMAVMVVYVIFRHLSNLLDVGWDYLLLIYEYGAVRLQIEWGGNKVWLQLIQQHQ